MTSSSASDAGNQQVQRYSKQRVRVTTNRESQLQRYNSTGISDCRSADAAALKPDEADDREHQREKGKGD